MSYRVRDVLESVQQAAPAPHTTTDDIIARARRIRARRTAAVVTGSAAAVLAVVVAATAGQGAPTGKTPPAAQGPSVAQGPSIAVPLPGSLLTPPDTFSTMLGEYRVGPYQIGPVGAVTAGFQELPVYRDGQTWNADDGTPYPLSDGLITIYRPGVFSPDTFGADEPTDYSFGAEFPVTVAGRPGIGREVSQSVSPSGGVDPSGPSNPQDRYVRTALAWQYEPGAWATYLPQFLLRNESTQDAVRVAAAVTPKPRRQVRLPYSLDYLPVGWQIVAVTETRAKLSNQVSEVFLHDGPIPAANLRDKVDLRLPGVHIVVMKGQPKDGDIRGQDGVHCYAPQPACTVVSGDYLIDVDGRGSDLTETDVRQIVLGLHPVDLADQDTWVKVDK